MFPLTTILLLIPALMLAGGPDRDVREDFKKINLAYSKCQKFQMGVVFNAYSNWADSMPVESLDGEFKKSGSKTYYRVGKLEYIKNESYSVVTDHEEKTISILPVIKEQGQEDLPSVLALVESTISQVKSSRYSEPDQKTGKYEIVFPSGYSSYEKAEFFFDKKKYFIEKMVLFFKDPQNLISDDDNGSIEKPRLEISYSDITTNMQASEDCFTYQKFVAIKNGKMYCREPYKKYSLINQL